MNKADKDTQIAPEPAEEVVGTAEALENLIKRVKRAQKEFATFSQTQVNAIFKAAATAADKARIPLAKMAVEDTGMGIVEDKIIKNHFAAEYIYNKYKNEKTCGVIRSDRTNGTKIVAEPLGVIAGIIPTTNPTSTAIYIVDLPENAQRNYLFPAPACQKINHCCRPVDSRCSGCRRCAERHYCLD